MAVQAQKSKSALYCKAARKSTRWRPSKAYTTSLSCSHLLIPFVLGRLELSLSVVKFTSLHSRAVSLTSEIHKQIEFAARECWMEKVTHQ